MNNSLDIHLAAKERGKSVLEYLQTHKEALEVAKALAKKSQDESLPGIERLSALMSLNDMLLALDSLLYETDESGVPHPEESEYRWVNGAKVKVPRETK